GVRSVTFASPVLSVPRWQADARVAIAALPAEHRAAIARAESTGDFASPDFLAAAQAYHARHVLRIAPPEPYQRAVAHSGAACYTAMWGPCEFLVTGSLRTYARASRLSALRLPALFTCGEFDEATPTTTAWYRDRAPNARFVVIPNSAHMPHLEQPEAYLAVLRAFLRDTSSS
ncbi:MAG: alpha/beta hydrolase, partial [Dehalococcoidia bacterium]|nr:alpha/beta hydrolase [Dehalococcoidia bacterium]